MSLDWKNLGFEQLKTNAAIRVDYTDGNWGPINAFTDETITLHMGAQALHYGQSCFEGLKAFTMKNGSIAMFRPDMNAKRLIQSANRICMQAPPVELFIEACKKAIELNRDLVPPYGSGASLYMRPLLIGTEPMFAIKPSSTYSFYVMVSPVGPYYKNGFSAIDALVVKEFDRAAPHGTGQAKVAGNYAASLIGSQVANEKGFPIVLYLDAKEGKYVDEFGTSNFIGITPDGEYHTPDSESVLKSITNDSLRTLAQDMGLKVSQKPIKIDEINQYSEVGACGTAAIITPIASITHEGTVVRFESPSDKSVIKKLYENIQGIQYGEIEDKHHWMTPI